MPVEAAESWLLRSAYWSEVLRLRSATAALLSPLAVTVWALAFFSCCTWLLRSATLRSRASIWAWVLSVAARAGVVRPAMAAPARRKLRKEKVIGDDPLLRRAA